MPASLPATRKAAPSRRIFAAAEVASPCPIENSLGAATFPIGRFRLSGPDRLEHPHYQRDGATSSSSGDDGVAAHRPEQGGMNLKSSCDRPQRQLRFRCWLKQRKHC
jgi:hypothetical protein